jgi:hypothetical protein
MVTVIFKTDADNADLQRLFDLARRFKLSFQIADVKDIDGESVGEVQPTKEEFLSDLRASFIEAKHNIDNGIEGITIEEFLAQDDEAVNTEKNVSHAY